MDHATPLGYWVNNWHGSFFDTNLPILWTESTIQAAQLIKFVQSKFMILHTLHNLSKEKRQISVVNANSRITQRFTLSRICESCLDCQHFWIFDMDFSIWFLYLQSWTKVLGHFGVSVGRFPIHTGPTPTPILSCLPSPHKQCWTHISRIVSEFQLCIGWGEGELQENFKKDALF